MIQYLLECIAFQLVFLIIYDLFFKQETFFQWNRAYLIGTYLLSLILPWIKIEALKKSVPEKYYVYPEYLWGANDAIATVAVDAQQPVLSLEQYILGAGMLVASVFFGYKIWKLNRLRKRGKVIPFKDFTQILISDSQIAFSFFKSIFLGDNIVGKERRNIIAHELVHIRQRHTYDLLFFELMRVIGWFNPLVYVYQSRTSELHEFIADAEASKDGKADQCELLLSQAFQTQNISFINQFHTSSLIKKRIVMLTKKKSLHIWKLKYLALVPLVVGMLFYTSCERDSYEGEGLKDSITVGDVENLTEAEENKAFDRLINLSVQSEYWEYTIKDENSSIRFSRPENKNSVISGPDGVPIKAEMHIESKVLKEDFDFFKFDADEGVRINVNPNLIPFAEVEEVPVFPGCENEADTRACFQKMIQRHISKNFRYPQEAQNKGIQGRVAVMFTIDEEGRITDIRKRGPHALLENETVRIIEKLPQMKPGKAGGKAVRVPFSIPINFKLEGTGFNANAKEFSYSRLLGEKVSQFPNEAQVAYENGIPFATVEQAPIFPGCEGASDPRACFQKSIQRHISKNFRYPQDAQERGIQGRVAIMFLIDEQGNITNIAKRGPDKSLEEEAERIISRLPQMKPGSQDGQNVNVPFSVPISFRLK